MLNPNQLSRVTDGSYATRRPLRIAVVTETYPPEINGVANTVATMVKGLRARRHDVQVVRPQQTPSDQPGSAGGMSDILTRGMQIPMYKELRLGFPAKSLLVAQWTKCRPDVVHIATEGPLGWSALKAAVQLRLPVCSDFRTNFQAYSEHYGIGWLQKPIMAYLRSFHNRCYSTMVPTEQQRHTLANAGLESLHVIARGVDTQKFSPAKRSQGLRERWGAAAQDVVVIHVGRLAPEKNLGVLLQAFERVQMAKSRVRLVVVGDGPQRAQLQAQCPQAHFAGFQSGDALAAHYASGDVFLFPSLTETYGNVTLEAMASGLAVVAFDDAAAGQLIEQGQNGLLAPKTDASAFLSHASELASDPAMRHRFGIAARASSMQYGWDAVLQKIEDIYVQTIQRADAPKPAAQQQRYQLS